MKNAIFIDNNDNEYKCNICSEIIENGKIVGLTCDPEKHIFCYDCIFDWYNELKINKKFDYSSTLNMCPICRKNGGLLPIYNNSICITGIHQNINVKKINICGAKFITKDGFCQFIGKEKYGGFCSKHMLTEPVSSQPVSSQPIQNVSNKECGFKYKTKLGYCKSLGKLEYNNLCGLHFKCNKNFIQLVSTENVNYTII